MMASLESSSSSFLFGRKNDSVFVLYIVLFIVTLGRQKPGSHNTEILRFQVKYLVQLLVFHYKVALHLFSPLIVWMKKNHSIVKKVSFLEAILKFLVCSDKTPKTQKIFSLILQKTTGKYLHLEPQQKLWHCCFKKWLKQWITYNKNSCRLIF